MEKKSKKELLVLIEEQSKSLTKYKSRLHDIVGSYKHLVKEKETLEVSIKTLTDVGSSSVFPVDVNDLCSINPNLSPSEKVNDDSLQKLKSSLGALTVEKARAENELRADRKKLLLQIEELERNAVENEKKWSMERQKYENLIHDLKKKVSNQQREREKEQQDHSLMLKELQNLLAVERANKEKIEDQVADLHHKVSFKLSDKKAHDYEKYIDDLQNKLKVAQIQWQTAENISKNRLIMMQKMEEELDDMKTQYYTKMDEETKRADVAEEKLKLLTIVKEKRIANLESRISELSDMVGNYDKTKQHDLLTIQRLKEKVNQLQIGHCTLNKIAVGDNKLWDLGQPNSDDQRLHLKNISPLDDSDAGNMLNIGCDRDVLPSENVHGHCQAEILQLKDELDFLKSKAENAMKEKYNKTSAALLSDAKAEKEIKELKRKISQLQDQLQASKSQTKLNEEYHNKITSNLEKSLDELKVLQKQELAQMKVGYQAKLLELEHQIQKQRERTLSLLEEKDKEIGLLKSTFLSSIIKKENSSDNLSPEDMNETAALDHEAAATLLSNSLISSQKDGHILHYAQELARKDIEITNLRQCRIQTESALRKLQQVSIGMEEKHTEEIEYLKSRIKLLESSKDKDGTNVEYLKNVVLRFLKTNDPNSQRHMVNAIATVLHFTNTEVQEVKAYLKALR